MKYTASVLLEHNEALASKVNLDTGEIQDLPIDPNRSRYATKDKTMEKFKHPEPFQRRFTRAWILLETQTTKQEFAVANKMAYLAKAFTNSLEPLSPDSTVKTMSECFNISNRDITKIIDKLFKLGVIGKFEVYDKKEHHHNYWIFNPYLAFNGNRIKKDVSTLFDSTFYAHLS